MRLFTTIFCMLLSFSVKMAATSPDSCYVYKTAEWLVSFKGGVISEQAGDKKDNQTLTNSKGEKLKFVNVMTALNYLTKDGWELADMIYIPSDPSRNNGPNYTFLLRKKMSGEEALKYSTPMNPD